MSFFDELKRRNVVRVGFAYAVIAWVLAQVAEFAADNFGAPDWFLRMFVVFLLLGLPLALFFAWAFEVTPEGIKREKDVDRSQSITTQTGRKLDFVFIGVLVIAVGFLLVDKFMVTSEPAVAVVESDSAETRTESGDEIITTGQAIAVLPFVNMSDDKDYFADGLSEELLNLLAKIPGLKVAGRTSSFAFKGKSEDLRKIGEALGVTTVLEGSVRRSGDRLRITAQLIKVEDGFHLWSETYDRKMADIFDIQDDVASAITNALRLELSPQQDRPTDNVDAYALYVEVLALVAYFDTNWFEQALEKIGRAIELDPAFAKAWALKAEIYWFAGGAEITTSESRQLIFDAATKALELDPTLSRARAFAVSADPQISSWLVELEAFEELLKAEPDNANGLDATAYVLLVTGYPADALRYADHMVELEPSVGFRQIRRGEALNSLGRHEEAHEAWQQAATLGYSDAYRHIGFDYFRQGEDEEGIAAYEKAYALAGEESPGIRALVDGARNPETGREFLQQWVNSHLSDTMTSYEKFENYIWHLAFGDFDGYWKIIDELSDGGENITWTDASLQMHWAMVFAESGFLQHRRYIEHAISSGFVELWDKRGAPEFCSKENDEWTCE